jgi:hypothetical protein
MSITGCFTKGSPEGFRAEDRLDIGLTQSCLKIPNTALSQTTLEQKKTRGHAEREEPPQWAD